VIGGAEPKLRYSEFAGFDYQSPQTISVERKLSPRLFDEFLRELYQTGIIDEEPCCSAAFDGIYSGLEVWSHGKYLAYSSNVPELAIGEIARVFLELCASTCNSQPSYIADNFVPHDH
jgi:hypothetical protein